jgi:transposase
MVERSKEERAMVVGLDLADRQSQVCVVARESGAIVEETKIRTTPAALEKRFAAQPRMLIALEVGAHSPWVSRLLSRWGHEVLVANASRLPLIYENRRKSDRADARYLARLARLDPALLAPIGHRGEQAQVDLARLRSRDLLVRCRTGLISHVRGMVKSLGCQLPQCEVETFEKRAAPAIPESLKPALEPVLDTIAGLNEQIRQYDREIEAMTAARYPETRLLRQVRGVGPLTSAAFVLTLEDPTRFRKSRIVGAYLGLVPGRKSSGESEPQRRITKQGDLYLRQLLVQCAQYLLGPFGQDCDLRRYGERLAARGGKNAKKRALVAVARKLAVLLHRLWRNGEVYEPLHQAARDAETLVPAN